MKIIEACISGFLFSLGSIPVVAFVFITGRGEYPYFITYKIMVIVLLLASFLLGFITYFLLNKNEKFFSHWKKYFICGCIAWAVAVFVLAGLNLTPLCIGQENGDGFNDVTTCILLTIFNTIYFTPFVLAGISLGSFLSAGAYIRIFRSSKVDELVTNQEAAIR